MKMQKEKHTLPNSYFTQQESYFAFMHAIWSAGQHTEKSY